MNVSRKNPLHLSTLLIVAGTAFALLLIVIPGEIDDRYYARDFQQQSHGWPWVHLHRFVPKPNSEGEGREQLQQRLETYRKHGKAVDQLSRANCGALDCLESCSENAVNCSFLVRPGRGGRAENSKKAFACLAHC